MNFRIVKKGYDTKETNDYILKITKEYTSEIEKQKAIILSLKDKLSQTINKVKDMESKKKMISQALIKAVEQSTEMERNAKQKMDSEIASLKAFHLRWTSYYKELIQAYPNEEVKKAEEFTKKINELFISPSHIDKVALDLFYKEQKLGLEEKSIANLECEKSEISENEINLLLGQIETDL